jgi:hypothetical protein
MERLFVGMPRIAAASAVAVALIGANAALAFSSSDYSLLGDATYAAGNASPRSVQLVSDADPGYGAVDYHVASGTTFAELEALSTDYRFEADDSCAGGAPRFSMGLSDQDSGDSGNIFVYLGDAPNYTNCPAGVWTNSGDLLGSEPLDTTQLDGGTFYDSYADALAKYGSYEVTSLQLVTDAGWAAQDGEQTVSIDNTKINDTLYTYEIPVATDKEQCKNGGYKNYTDQNGNSFKNQGQCVSSTVKNAHAH